MLGVLNKLTKVLVGNLLQNDTVEKSKMTMLRYKKTLDIVEKFMIDSRIREYCTDICKGRCCEGCYKKNKYACHRQEGRRLPCSIYLCTSLYRRFSKKDIKILSEIKITVLKECHRFTKNNVYFNTPTKKFFKQSIFPLKIIGKLNEDMAKKINIIMTELIKNEINIQTTVKMVHTNE